MIQCCTDIKVLYTVSTKQNHFKDVQEAMQQKEVAALQGRGCTRIRSGDFLTASPPLFLLLNPNRQLLFLISMPHLHFPSTAHCSKCCLKVDLKNREKPLIQTQRKIPSTPYEFLLKKNLGHTCLYPKWPWKNRWFLLDVKLLFYFLVFGFKWWSKTCILKMLSFIYFKLFILGCLTQIM